MTPPNSRPAFPKDPAFQLGKPITRTQPPKSKPGRRAISPASPEQREKSRRLSSIVSGGTPCDPSHLTSRAHGGCDDALCTVPLTREEHRAFDDGQLDLLRHLIAHGCWAEMAHAIEAHQVDPIALVQRLTGERYVPGERPTRGRHQ